MNPDTGEIQEFETDELAKKAGFTVPVKRLPDADCPKCWGKGSVWSPGKGRQRYRWWWKPCQCVK